MAARGIGFLGRAGRALAASAPRRSLASHHRNPPTAALAGRLRTATTTSTVPTPTAAPTAAPTVVPALRASCQLHTGPARLSEFPRPPAVSNRPTLSELRAENLDLGRESVNTIAVTAKTRALLIATFVFRPADVPERIRPGTLNTAWARARFVVATLAMLSIVCLAEMAIQRGQHIRDAGEESLFDDAEATRQRTARRERFQRHQQLVAEHAAAASTK